MPKCIGFCCTFDVFNALGEKNVAYVLAHHVYMPTPNYEITTFSSNVI